MTAFILESGTVNGRHGVEQHRSKIFHTAVINCFHTKLIRIDHFVFLSVFFKESQHTRIHHTVSAPAHHKDIKMILIRYLKRSMEIFRTVQITAVHPLHFLK